MAKSIAQRLSALEKLVARLLKPENLMSVRKKKSKKKKKTSAKRKTTKRKAVRRKTTKRKSAKRNRPAPMIFPPPVLM